MSFNKDALMHKLQDENDKLKEKLKSWIDADMLDNVPTYIENRDLRNERTRYMLDKEQYKATIDHLRKLWEHWEDVPDEDLWEDGEIDTLEVQHKIIKHTMQIGDWRLIRRIEK